MMTSYHSDTGTVIFSTSDTSQFVMISNDGAADITVKVAGSEMVVKAGEVLREFPGDFNVVVVVATATAWRIWTSADADMNHANLGLFKNTGAKGETGAAGADGENGLPGAPGLQGEAGVIAIVGTPATGDILYYTALGAWAVLPVGDDGDVLTLASGVPAWVAP